MFVFLELETVLAIHRRSLAEYGGSAGVRDAGLIESALGSAKNTAFYGGGDVFDVAAAYAFHLAEAQAFLDGNKRTGLGRSFALLLPVRRMLPIVFRPECFGGLLDFAFRQVPPGDGL